MSFLWPRPFLAICAFLVVLSTLFSAPVEAAWPEGFCVSDDGRALACLNEVDASPLDEKIPAILIHGWNRESTPGQPRPDHWDSLKRYLQIIDNAELLTEFKFYEFNYLSNWRNVRTLARLLRDVIGRQSGADPQFGAKRLVLVSYSMGGLIGRQFLRIQFRGKPAGERVAVLVTLGTPHHGSPLANGPAATRGLSTRGRLLWRTAEEIAFPEGAPRWWEVNRSDLRWDNFDGALDYSSIHSGERNRLLEEMNRDTTYDKKVIAYGGALGACSIAREFRRQKFYCLFNTFVANFFSMASDGVVPLRSALAYKVPGGNSRFARTRYFTDHDHDQMVEGRSDGSLFAALKADLLKAIGKRPRSIATLRIDGKMSSAGSVRHTFVFSGDGYTPNRPVTRFLRNPDGRETVLSPTLSADQNGGIHWEFTPTCSSQLGTFTLWATDQSTRRRSNDVTEVLTESSSCAGEPPKLAVDGRTSSSGSVGHTFVFRGEEFSLNQPVDRFLRGPDGQDSTLAPALKADSRGNLEWEFAPSCSTPLGIYRVWAVDSTTGRQSNTVQETITASPSCTSQLRPSVRTLPASEVTVDSAVMHGHADPKGSPAEFWFETSTNLSTLLAGNGDKTPRETFDFARHFQGTLRPLPSDTTFHFRTAAQRDGGIVVYGEALSFRTLSATLSPPAVFTDSASGITSTSATLNGRISPNGHQGGGEFWWSDNPNDLSDDDDAQVIRGVASLGGGTGTFAVSAPISGLMPDAVYYFRLVGLPVAGSKVLGSIRSFDTDVGMDSYVDLGNPGDERFHNLRGWGNVNSGLLPLGIGDDRTSRYQRIRSDNSFDLWLGTFVGQTFELVFRTEDAFCDDSFDVYLNGHGPVYSYQSGTSGERFPLHRVYLTPGLNNGGITTVTFRNRASDDCGGAAVYFVDGSGSFGPS